MTKEEKTDIMAYVVPIISLIGFIYILATDDHTGTMTGYFFGWALTLFVFIIYYVEIRDKMSHKASIVKNRNVYIDEGIYDGYVTKVGKNQQNK